MDLLLVDYNNHSTEVNLIEKIGDRLVVPVWVNDVSVEDEEAVKGELWAAYCALRAARREFFMDEVQV